MNGKLVGIILIAGLVAFSARIAVSDEFHYTNLLIGDRASGMGGAYTAISDDATGLYYNPAGISYATGRSINASVNAFYNTEKIYKSVIGGNGWVRTSSSLLPNYFGVVQPMGKFKVGISYAVPESITEDQDQTFHDLPLSTTSEAGLPSVADLNPGAQIQSYIINFNNETNTNNVGPSIAAELNDQLSVGLTLYYYQRKTQWILNQIIKTNTGGYEWTNTYFQTEEQGIRPILGIMWAPVKNVSLGLAVSTIQPWQAKTTFQQAYRRQGLAVYADTDGDGVKDSAVSDVTSLPDGVSSFSTTRKYPVQVGFGVAWFVSQSLLVSSDINHFTAVADQGLNEVNNLAVGAEYYLTKSLAMRTGFYTNYANTPPIAQGKTDQNEHIDMYGGTLSLSHFTRNTSVTLGGGYTFGAGQAQIIGNSKSIQDAVSTGWMFFLSSSYSY